jgi:hypothetical protein
MRTDYARPRTCRPCGDAHNRRNLLVAKKPGDRSPGLPVLPAREIWRRLGETGQVTLRVARPLSAERAAEARRILEAGGTGGRLVLKF